MFRKEHQIMSAAKCTFNIFERDQQSTQKYTQQTKSSTIRSSSRSTAFCLLLQRKVFYKCAH